MKKLLMFALWAHLVIWMIASVHSGWVYFEPRLRAWLDRRQVMATYYSSLTNPAACMVVTNPAAFITFTNHLVIWKEEIKP